MSRRTAIKAARAARRREQARRRARRNRRVLGVSVAVVLVAIGAAVAVTTGHKPSRVSATTAGFRFSYLDGRQGSLADFGARPVVVNFFASWCPTCWEEMVDFERVYRETKDRIGFLGLALQETPEGARSIVSKTGVTYPLGADPEGKIFRKLGGQVMPTTVFFDDHGKQVRTVTGGLDAARLRALIRRLFIDRKEDVQVSQNPDKAP